MARQQHRFSIYDMMENKGVFDMNPANPSSGPDYIKAEYPRMLYHPEGKEKITVAAEIIVTPFGPKAVNEHREIISKVVNSAADEAVLLNKGWHTHPAKAIEASGKEAPATSSAEHIEALQAQLKALTRQLEEASKSKIATKPSDDDEDEAPAKAKPASK